MGATLNIVSLDPKIQTFEKAKKVFDKMAAYDRHENGHSYSGGIGMLEGLTYAGEFNSIEDFDNWLMKSDSKNRGWVAKIKIIRRTIPLEKAQKAEWAAQAEMNKNLDAAPSVQRRLQAKYIKAKEKAKKLLDAQADKSKKFHFAVGGWCAM